MKSKPSPPLNDQIEPVQEKEHQTTSTEAAHETPSSTSQPNENEIQIENKPDVQDTNEITGVKACDDTRYRKYFKMLQFGVPAPAVKLKMANEGLDSNILK